MLKSSLAPKEVSTADVGGGIIYRPLHLLDKKLLLFWGQRSTHFEKLFLLSWMLVSWEQVLRVTGCAGADTFFCKGPNTFGFLNHRICNNYPTDAVFVWKKSCFRQYVNEWLWVCSNTFICKNRQAGSGLWTVGWLHPGCAMSSLTSGSQVTEALSSLINETLVCFWCAKRWGPR